MGEAARLLYEFIWDELCDWYIELGKPRLYGRGTPESRRTAQQVIWYVLRQTLELLHPFMPFLTEEIWQHLPRPDASAGSSIMIAPWPQRRPELEDPESERDMAALMDLIRGIRNLRGEMGLPPGKPARCVVVVAEASFRQLLERHASYITQLTMAQPLEFAGPEQPKPKQALSLVVRSAEAYIPLAGLLDLDREIARLAKEGAALEQDLVKVRGKLSNEDFLAKAPPAVIEKERGREAEMEQKLTAIRRRLDAIKS